VPEKPKPDKESSPGSTDELWNLVHRAENGDTKAVPALRELLSRSPGLTDLLGNLPHLVETTLANNVAGKNISFKEGLARKMELLRQEIAGPNPTPLERLLAERIALCWLALHDAEIRFAHMKELSIPQAEYWQNRIDRAHRRYLSAIRTLATVRKLAVPVLQVNIAKKQVNVAGSGTMEGG